MNPIVTVIVPHHLNENQKYLDWCLDSILSSNIDLEVLVYASSENKPSVPDDKRLTLRWDKELYPNCTSKFHAGIKDASTSSKYMMLISDDVIVSKYCIRELAEACGDMGAIMGPASNCDATTRYSAVFNVWDWRGENCVIPQKCSLEDIAGFEHAVINYPVAKRILLDPGWISFYCTMFPKTVLNAVGLFNNAMDVRWNDVEFCKRARAKGIPAFINLGAFALHFGDKTLPKSTKPEDYEVADEAWKQSCAYL